MAQRRHHRRRRRFSDGEPAAGGSRGSILSKLKALPKKKRVLLALGIMGGGSLIAYILFHSSVASAATSAAQLAQTVAAKVGGTVGPANTIIINGSTYRASIRQGVTVLGKVSGTGADLLSLPVTGPMTVQQRAASVGF